MAKTPFKMKGFSGFGNSPVKNDDKYVSRAVLEDGKNIYDASKAKELLKTNIEAKKGLLSDKDRAASIDTITAGNKRYFERARNPYIKSLSKDFKVKNKSISKMPTSELSKATRRSDERVSFHDHVVDSYGHGDVKGAKKQLDRNIKFHSNVISRKKAIETSTKFAPKITPEQIKKSKGTLKENKPKIRFFGPKI
tara:strand:- start:60 stop:644 length:585 start_codon:yes stop_codon:yes gene_type:complete